MNDTLIKSTTIKEGSRRLKVELFKGVDALGKTIYRVVWLTPRRRQYLFGSIFPSFDKALNYYEEITK